MSENNEKIDQITANLVYHYLVDKGYLETAKKLKKKRKFAVTPINFDNFTLKDIFSCLMKEFMRRRKKLKKFANSIVFDYLKNHKMPGVRKMAIELKKEGPIFLNRTKNFLVINKAS